MESHGRTGRDSVLAMHKRNDLAPRNDISQDDIDDDLLWRIESQLIKSHEYIDLTELRKELQKRDLAKCGIIDAAMVRKMSGFIILHYICSPTDSSGKTQLAFLGKTSVTMV